MTLKATPITESATYEATINAPEDATEVLASDVETPVTKLANRTKYINENATNGLPSKLPLAGGTMTGALVVNHANGVVTTGKGEFGTTLKVDGGIINNPSFTDGLRSNDKIEFTGTQPAIDDDPGDNVANATNQTKAWIHVTVASGVISVVDSYNMVTASLALVSANELLSINMVASLADDKYGVRVTNQDIATPRIVAGKATTSTNMLVRVWDVTGGVLDLTTDDVDLLVEVIGRQ